MDYYRGMSTKDLTIVEMVEYYDLLIEHEYYTQAYFVKKQLENETSKSMLKIRMEFNI